MLLWLSSVVSQSLNNTGCLDEHGTICSGRGECLGDTCSCPLYFDPASNCATCVNGFTLLGGRCVHSGSCVFDGKECYGHGQCELIITETAEEQYRCQCYNGYNPASNCAHCPQEEYVESTDKLACFARQCNTGTDDAPIECGGNGKCQYAEYNGVQKAFCVCKTLNMGLMCIECADGFRWNANKTQCFEDKCATDLGECGFNGECVEHEAKRLFQCTCMHEGMDPETGCITCINEYDMATECTTCIGNYELSSLCYRCRPGFSDATGCTQCAPNYNPATNCSTCLQRQSLARKCQECDRGQRLIKGQCVAGLKTTRVVVPILLVVLLVGLIVVGALAARRWVEHKRQLREEMFVRTARPAAEFGIRVLNTQE